MFHVEFHFEELPLVIGRTEFSVCSGVAHLQGENGTHDYGFRVSHIELEGNLLGDYRDKRRVPICQRSDDPFCVLLFQRLAARIEAHKEASDCFYDALREAMWEQTSDRRLAAN
ncbi:hypothetical protein [Hoeflea prorocentri]|uniref:Uncharacterized protein n=1 Tax=Hoeflea prorocentri TaxID=1922333 RepID=A0A9X3UGS1_9HYPH|nr:hypothetical protein [Hoeflea prorocentri]MCY6381078.1 hypothetical protein [Hoeflea prorocentri]MDA5398878.1 hypothetical protein [Hoeflea prorocentri]